ncbi:hypothetical protein V6N12_067671 [Hibiscus sabdariffa]|uniref:DUF4283 domain-containing protein n=1 Tax=Hibiscus sabdariffa TaxID=183260 RepID=A0ABR2B7P7_9ROSI
MNSDLGDALRAENVGGVRVMQISGSSFDHVFDWNEAESALVNHRVWISVFGVPIHVWASETFERLVAYWGSVIQVVEKTVEPSSFEKGNVLIETTSMDRIEECLELRIKDKSFPIRITKADTFLCGRRYYCVCKSHCSDSDNELGVQLPSKNGMEQDICGTEDREEALSQMSPAPNEITCGGMNEWMVREEGIPGEVISEMRLQGQTDEVSWRGNALWEGSPIVSIPPSPVLDADMDLVTVPIEEESVRSPEEKKLSCEGVF